MGDLWRRFGAQSTRIQWLSGLIAAVLVVGVVGVITANPKTKTVTATPTSPSTAVVTTTAPPRSGVPTTTVPPTTATTRSPPPSLPSATVSMTTTGTSAANYVSILVNGKERQYTQVALPAMYQVGAPDRLGVVASAQIGSGQAGAAITCTINLHNGSRPVTKTAMGPYAIALCNSNTR